MNMFVIVFAFAVGMIVGMGIVIRHYEEGK